MPSRIAPWFLLAALSVVSADYYEAGSTVVLRPQPVSGNINSITWKSNGDIVAEWIQGKLELEYFGRFKNHATLDLLTAVLTLKDANANHNGRYIVEINFQAHGKAYDVHILNPLQKPRVSVQPLVCGPELERCTLVCASDVKGVGNVTYSWSADGKDQVSEMAVNTLNIVKAETQGVEYYSCKIKNPIKELESEGFKNPFYVQPFPMYIIGIVIVVVLIIAAVVLGLWKMQDKLRSLCNTGERSVELPTHNGAGSHEVQPLSQPEKGP